jgi:hypothetical protein
MFSEFEAQRCSEALSRIFGVAAFVSTSTLAVPRSLRCRRETFDQLDDFEPLPRRELDEGFQEPQTFDSFARWSSELLVQLCNKCGIFHLAPLTGNGKGISGQT